MLTSHYNAIGPSIRGKTLLQCGARETLEDNAGYMAASLGAQHILLAPYSPWTDRMDELEAAIMSMGCEVGRVDLPIEEIRTSQDPRVCDVAFCDDLLFRIEDPYRHLVGLRNVTRERVIVSTVLAPHLPPDNWPVETWPIFEGFQAYGAALDNHEAQILLTGFRAWGLDGECFRKPAITHMNQSTGKRYNDSAWTWYWTQQILMEALLSAGFEPDNIEYIWKKIGILVEAS